MKGVPPGRAVVFFAIVLAGSSLDLATKHWIFAWLGSPPAPRWQLWKNIYFETSLNEGALFGFGQGFWIVFSILSALAIEAILYWLFYAGFARDLLLTVALGLITAGILGNLYDRLGLPGLKWGPGSWHRTGDNRPENARQDSPDRVPVARRVYPGEVAVHFQEHLLRSLHLFGRRVLRHRGQHEPLFRREIRPCLLYTSDAADDLLCVDLGGRRIIKKKNYREHNTIET